MLDTFFRGLYAMSSHISRNAMKYAIVTFGDCCGLQKQKPLFYLMKNILLQNENVYCVNSIVHK